MLDRFALVSGVAILAAAQTLSSLVSTQIQGVVVMEQDGQSKQKRWNEATQWSFPKSEIIRVVIPGIYGYRMDTPDGGEYWGAVGQTPGWEQHHQGSPRSSGSGEYAGIFVVLLAFYALMQSFRKTGSPFSDKEKKIIWFWSVAAVISLLLAFGRHAPFYQLLYRLPYFSTIRNPIKFMQPFHLSVGILFGFGLAGLSRLYLEKTVIETVSVQQRLSKWWSSSKGFEKQWFYGIFGLLCVSFFRPVVIFLNAEADC